MSDTPEPEIFQRIRQRVLFFTLFLTVVLVGGTAGYKLLVGEKYSALDCLYMTVITVTTIGYGEILDFAQQPAGRVFTMVLAFFGVGIFTYIMSSVTTLAADSELRAQWRRRQMEKAIARLDGHYILCGGTPVARQIERELAATRRPFVLIRPDGPEVGAPPAAPPPLWLAGDAADDDVLGRAGIARAAGVFAATEADHTNIVISLSARRLNPKVRIVACVQDPRYAEKMKKAGADAVVSAIAIGGLRMASEMVRPAVVSFLDTMLRDPSQPLRIEEVCLGPAHGGRSVGELGLDGFPRTLLVALRRGDGGWIFNPPARHQTAAGDTLILMTAPDELEALTVKFGRA